MTLSRRKKNEDPIKIGNKCVAKFEGKQLHGQNARPCMRAVWQQLRLPPLLLTHIVEQSQMAQAGFKNEE